MEILYNHNFVRTNKVHKDRSLEFFTFLYTFSSGFVFFEPGFSEILFLIFIPFLIKKINKTIFYITLLTLFLPGIISAVYGLIFFDLINIKFLTIDIYLFTFFIIFASKIFSTRDSYEVSRIINLTMISWTLGGLVNVLAGILCYLTGRTDVFGLKIIIYGIRLKGFFKDPNVLGPFLVVPAIWNFSKAYSAPKKIINWVLFIILSFGVLITFSRAAWLNLALSFSLYLIFSFKKNFVRNFVIFCLLFLVILSLWNYVSNVKLLDYSIIDFLVERAKLQRYDQERFSMWKAVAKVLTNSTIIFGTGPGNYEAHTEISTHSLYFRLLGERGALGASLFIFFLLFIINKAIKSTHYWLSCSIFGQLVNSMFIDSLHWRHLWILLSLVFLVKLKMQKENNYDMLKKSHQENSKYTYTNLIKFY